MNVLFDWQNFVPRHQCGAWDGLLMAVYITASLAITLAYIAIPFALLRWRWEWAVVARSRRLQVCFAAFILFCGIGHLEGVISFRYPAYHAFALWHMATAVVSWITILALLAEREISIAEQKKPPVGGSP